MPAQRRRRQATNNHRKKRHRDTQNEYCVDQGLSANGWSTLQTFKKCWVLLIRTSLLFTQMTSVFVMLHHLGLNGILPGVNINAMEHAIRGSMAMNIASFSMVGILESV